MKKLLDLVAIGVLLLFFTAALCCGGCTKLVIEPPCIKCGWGQKPDTAYLFVFSGESNSGGVALNSDAAPYEIGVRKSVLIWDNVGGTGWDTLNIGVNNLLGHFGFTEAQTHLFHGWELGLANAADSGRFKRTPVYLTKTGQGSSRISQWDSTDPSGYWVKMKHRVDSSTAELKSRGIPFKMVIWYSQGINDRIYGTPRSTWKEKTIAHLNKIHDAFGKDIPIIMVESMTNNGNDLYNPDMEDIAAIVPHVSTVKTTGLPVQADNNHWTYVSMKAIARSLIDETLK